MQKNWTSVFDKILYLVEADSTVVTPGRADASQNQILSRLSFRLLPKMRPLSLFARHFQISAAFALANRRRQLRELAPSEECGVDVVGLNSLLRRLLKVSSTLFVQSRDIDFIPLDLLQYTMTHIYDLLSVTFLEVMRFESTYDTFFNEDLLNQARDCVDLSMSYLCAVLHKDPSSKAVDIDISANDIVSSELFKLNGKLFSSATAISFCRRSVLPPRHSQTEISIKQRSDWCISLTLMHSLFEQFERTRAIASRDKSRIGDVSFIDLQQYSLSALIVEKILLDASLVMTSKMLSQSVNLVERLCNIIVTRKYCSIDGGVFLTSVMELLLPVTYCFAGINQIECIYLQNVDTQGDSDSSELDDIFECSLRVVSLAMSELFTLPLYVCPAASTPVFVTPWAASEVSERSIPVTLLPDLFHVAKCCFEETKSISKSEWKVCLQRLYSISVMLCSSRTDTSSILSNYLCLLKVDSDATLDRFAKDTSERLSQIKSCAPSLPRPYLSTADDINRMNFLYENLFSDYHAVGGPPAVSPVESTNTASAMLKAFPAEYYFGKVIEMERRLCPKMQLAFLNICFSSDSMDYLESWESIMSGILELCGAACDQLCNYSFPVSSFSALLDESEQFWFPFQDPCCFLKGTILGHLSGGLLLSSLSKLTPRCEEAAAEHALGSLCCFRSKNHVSVKEVQDIEFNALCMKYDRTKVSAPAEGFEKSNYEFSAEATWLLCSYINTAKWTFRRAYAYVMTVYSAKHRIQLTVDLSATNVEHLVQRYSMAVSGEKTAVSSRGSDLFQDKPLEMLSKPARGRSSSDRQNGDQIKQKRMLVDISEMGVLLEQTLAPFYLDGSEALKIVSDRTLKRCLEGLN